jgi:uncharacterized iron-regulated membrane protein
LNTDFARRGALWRIHGLAAMLATPFLLVAAVTGLIYVAAPQVEAWQDAHLDAVTPAPWLPLDRLVQAAEAAAPEGLRLRNVVPPRVPGDTLRATFAPPAGTAAAGSPQPAGPHAGHAMPTAALPAAATAAETGFGPRIPRGVIVHVDPGSARVLGTQVEGDRYSTWAKRLHSSLLQNDNWRWLIEWAATCLLVMLLSGAALAWPRKGVALLPQPGARGRTAWKQWHAFIGLALALMSLAIVLTGLTWSRYAGDQIRSLRDQIGQAPPRAPAGLQSAPANGSPRLSWQAVWDRARQQAPEAVLQISPPRGPQGVWRISNVDRGQPMQRLDLQLDATSGRALFFAGWQQQTLFSKATAIGIPFHRGEFGLWNQLLLVLFGVAVIFSTVTGWVMWFKRRRTGWLGLPALPAQAWRSVAWRWPALGAALALCWLAPLLLAFLALLLLAEWHAARKPAALAA